MGNQKADPGTEGGRGKIGRRKWVETSNQIQDKDDPLGGGRVRYLMMSVKRTLHSRAEQGYT